MRVHRVRQEKTTTYCGPLNKKMGSGYPCAAPPGGVTLWCGFNQGGGEIRTPSFAPAARRGGGTRRFSLKAVTRAAIHVLREPWYLEGQCMSEFSKLTPFSQSVVAVLKSDNKTRIAFLDDGVAIIDVRPCASRQMTVVSMQTNCLSKEKVIDLA